MKPINYFLLILLLLFSVILDVSFFSSLALNGASIMSAYLILMIGAVISKGRVFLVSLFAVTIFYSIFTSLPLFILLINFVIFPFFINFIRFRFFPKPALFSSLFYFVSAFALLFLVSLIYENSWDARAFSTMPYFVILNSAIGLIFYQIFLKAEAKLKVGEIKF
ncbi:MAG: hypothetical protein WC107_03700 [Patescibacteria group bacterium]